PRPTPTLAKDNDLISKAAARISAAPRPQQTTQNFSDRDSCCHIAPASLNSRNRSVMLRPENENHVPLVMVRWLPWRILGAARSTVAGDSDWPKYISASKP